MLLSQLRHNLLRGTNSWPLDIGGALEAEGELPYTYIK